MLYAWLKRLKLGGGELNYGREIVARMARDWSDRHPAADPLQVADLGVGPGTDLVNIRTALQPRRVQLAGVESHHPNIEQARPLGIDVAACDLERDRLPWADASLQIVVANQIVEHTKEVFWIFSEISRVLVPGGICIVGVPNLASLHNRVLLLFGAQPSSMEILGPHVRGMTRGALRRFVETDGYFRVTETAGSNFYPFPPRIGMPLGRAMPALAVSLFMCCERTSRPGRFIDVLESRFFETNFYRGA